ncbi:hypothetical protein GCM10017691_58160 [Pseudonocardia petroleophila]
MVAFFGVVRLCRSGVGSSGMNYRMTWRGGRPSPTDVPDPGSEARPGRARRPVVPNRDPTAWIDPEPDRLASWPQ